MEKVIRINRKFGGTPERTSSLDFAMDTTKGKEWITRLAHKLRAIIVDHTFSDGNKRTARYLVIEEFQNRRIEIRDDKINQMILKIAKNNINSITKIRRMIKNAGHIK